VFVFVAAPHAHPSARALVFEYIETYYNRRRRHSTLGYVGPAARERLLS